MHPCWQCHSNMTGIPSGLTMNGLLTVMVLVVVVTEALTSIPCRVSYHKDGAHVDCRHRNLTEVPNNLPRNTSHLDMSFNNITTLKNYSFSGLANVERLLLESSEIRFMEVNSFHGLTSLLELSLSYNNLPPSAYPTGVFRHLLKLTKLKLQDDLRTTHEISFPDKALADLVNLNELWLASPSAPVFGPGFGKLRHLECLYFHTRACQLTTLRNDTFQPLKDTHLKELYIIGCLLTTLEAGTFGNLPCLRVLYIEKARSIGLKPALRSLYGLVGKNMSLITFSAVGLETGENSMSKLKNNETLVLTKGMMTHLNHICVEKIDLSQNRIVMVEADVLDLCDTCLLKKCLKYIDASGNMMVGELSVAGKLLFFEQLEVMDVSYPSFSYHGSKRRKLQSTDLQASADARAKPSLMILLPRPIRSLNISGTYMYGHLSKRFSSIHIRTHNPNFTELVAADSDVLEGTRLYGAATLKSLDLSGADLWNMPSDMFHSLPNLEVLKLKDSKMDLARSDYQTLFEPLTKLTYLDLSGNMKPNIYENMFTNLSSVTHLRLSNTGLTDLPTSVKFLTRLQHLELSDNLISHFQPQTRQILDDIQQLSPRLSVSLRGNTLACGCNSVGFIEWMMTTDVVFVDVLTYRCIDEAGTVGPLMPEWTHYNTLWRACYSRIWLPTAVSAFLVVWIVILIAKLAKSYALPWKLFVLRTCGLPFDKPDRKHFQFDLFLYYASTEDQDLLSWIFTTFKQEMEDKRCLRMCIPDRNFDVGVSTADEIVMGINNSWKTVIFVTENFLEDEWCFFTLSSALYSTTTLMPKRVLLLYTQDVLEKGTSLPPALDQLLDQGTAMELDTNSDDNWWAELQEKVLAWI